MEQFKISENAAQKVLKKFFLRMGLFNIFIMIALLGFNFNNLNDLEVLKIIVPALLVALILGNYVAYKRLKGQLSSYTLTVTDTEIIREQKDTPTIGHLKSQITDITQYSNGAILIKAQNMKDAIGVSEHIENAERLKHLLNQIQPIKALESKTLLERMPIPIGIASVVLFGWFFNSKNIWVVEILGTIGAVTLIYSFFVMYNNKTVDNKTRRSMYLALIPLISIVGRMYLLAVHPNAFDKISNKKEIMPSETQDTLMSTIEIFRKAKPEDAKDYENGLINGIELDKLEAVVQDLDKPDEIVVSDNEVTLEIDYPLDSLYKATLKAVGKGFTRKELVREIGKRYHQIYKEEEASASIKTIPTDKREKIVNRNDTNGKYGIWGHDLSDLYLRDIEVYKTKDGKIVLRLNVDS